MLERRRAQMEVELAAIDARGDVGGYVDMKMLPASNVIITD